MINVNNQKFLVAIYEKDRGKCQES